MEAKRSGGCWMPGTGLGLPFRILLRHCFVSSNAAFWVTCCLHTMKGGVVVVAVVVAVVAVVVVVKDRCRSSSASAAADAPICARAAAPARHQCRS